MLIPAFSFKLNHKVLKGLVTTGKYDGEHPSIAFATEAGIDLNDNVFYTR